MADRRLLLALLLSAACPAAWAQNPVGPEFQVNSYTTGTQRGPAVAPGPAGNFVVVWTSDYQDGSDSGTFGQRFNAAGLPQGSEFQVNSYTTRSQYGPAVASDATGNFVVVWNSSGQDGSYAGVFGQRFNASGLPRGSEFQINSYTTFWQVAPAVSSDAGGNFVVVWEAEWQLGSYYTFWDVFGQRFNASGFPQGGQFVVNSYLTNYQAFPAVASDASGNFVVVWSSIEQDGSDWGVFGRRFDSSGLPQGTEFQVNSFTTSSQYRPAVASDANGNFVVVWTSWYQDGSRQGVFGQRFNALGVPQGSEFPVNSYTTGDQRYPKVTSDANGNFVVVWVDTGGLGIGHDGSDYGVFGRRFNAAGLPQGSEFQVNSYTTGSQGGAAVASDANGEFVVVWNGDGQDGSGVGIFGQRFGDLIFRDGFQ